MPVVPVLARESVSERVDLRSNTYLASKSPAVAAADTQNGISADECHSFIHLIDYRRRRHRPTLTTNTNEFNAKAAPAAVCCFLDDFFSSSDFNNIIIVCTANEPHVVRLYC